MTTKAEAEAQIVRIVKMVDAVRESQLSDRQKAAEINRLNGLIANLKAITGPRIIAGIAGTGRAPTRKPYDE